MSTAITQTRAWTSALLREGDGLRRYERQVLMTIAEFADDEGVAKVSMTELADAICGSESHVRRILKALTVRGLVKVETTKARHGGYAANRYRLMWGAGLDTDMPQMVAPLPIPATVEEVPATHTGEITLTDVKQRLAAILDGTDHRLDGQAPQTADDFADIATVMVPNFVAAHSGVKGLGTGWPLVEMVMFAAARAFVGEEPTEEKARDRYFQRLRRALKDCGTDIIYGLDEAGKNANGDVIAYATKVAKSRLADN